MKEIKILHLYYDLLNMFGENGNVVALVKALEKQKVKVTVDFKSINDDIDINSYDFIYIGSGNDEDYELAKNDLKKYKEDLLEYIYSNKFLLATGNAINLFGDLNILNYKSKSIDFRIVGDQIYETKLFKRKIIGFQNRNKVIYDVLEKNIFTVLNGTGYEPNINIEGIIKNNFYGTYLLGPLLVRNPYLLDYLTKKLLKSKNIKYKEVKKDITYDAYNEFLKNFMK